MKLGIAQIDGQLGDIEGMCLRLGALAHRAAEEGATLLCAPATVFSGPFPGGLLTYGAFQSDVLTRLSSLATDISASGVIVLVPLALPFGESSYFDVLILKEGRVVPSRLVCYRKRGAESPDAWAPPVFDHDGTRVALTFDAARDIEALPQGCDLIINFQVDSFDAGRGETWGAAGLEGPSLRDLARDRRVWIADVCPVGGFDEAVYAGGSFVVDDGGALAAAAPQFEEDLLLVDIDRLAAGGIEPVRAPMPSRHEMLWNALVLHLRDHVAASSYVGVTLELRGDLPSALLASLAVDALGARNVAGVIVPDDSAITPQQQALEDARVSRARCIASRLGMRVFDAPVAGPLEGERLVKGAFRFGLASSRVLQNVAIDLCLLPLSQLTKTDYALCGPIGPVCPAGSLAPFGDVCLTELEFLARYRNGVSSVIDPCLAGLPEIERLAGELLTRLIATCCQDGDSASQVALCLRDVSPSQIDSLIEAHVERDRSLSEIPLSRENRRAAAFLLLAIARGELARRSLPLHPITSRRAFDERRWPYQLVWSDMGEGEGAALDADSLAREEMRRVEGVEYGRGDRARGEIMSLIGDMLGLSPEQQRELASEEGARRMQERLESLEAAMSEQAARGGDRGSVEGAVPMPPMPMGPRDLPFFSLN